MPDVYTSLEAVDDLVDEDINGQTDEYQIVY